MMHKLLIVDDEIISRLGISNLMDWEEEGFNLIDSVENGQQALDILKEQSIDLVLTDMKMPVMSGIELIQSAREEGIQSQFIVLSSYDDYSYVREALKLGALDYILKLDLNKDHLKTILIKAREEIDKNSQSSDRTIDKQTISSARRDFLKQLFYGKVDEQGLRQDHLNHLQLNFPHNNFVTMMFKVEPLTNSENENSIRSIIEEILNEYEYAYISGTGYNELCILYNLPRNDDLTQFKSIERLAKRIVFIMKQYFNQKVTLYISETIQDLKDIPHSYLQVNQAYGYKNVISDESIMFFKNIMQERSGRDITSLKSFVGRVEKAIQRKNHEEAHSVLNEISEYVDHSGYIELSQINNFVFSLSYVMNQYMDEMGAGKSLWKSDEDQYKTLQSIRNKDDFIEFIAMIQKKFKETSSEESDNHIIRKVKKYLYEHYKEGVVLKDVSDSLGLTNTYLSMLFKKETGMTLKDYLIGLKIEKTKELLIETNLQIAEISKEIGYDNEHYFSRIFKQKTGMTPTAFRNQGIL